MKLESQLPRLQILSNKDIQKIYFAALEVLERTGVAVKNEEACDLLREAGAYVDGETARIPSSLIEKTVNLAPKQIILYSQDGQPAMRLSGSNSYFGSGENTLFVVDTFNGQRRNWMLEDINDSVVLQEQLEHIDYTAPLGYASDCAPKMSCLRQFESMVTYSNKPVFWSALDDRGVHNILEMASVVAPSGSLTEKPFMVQLTSAISPLVHTPEDLGKLLICAEKRLPSIYTPTHTGGATSPVTLAGTLVVCVAQALSLLAIMQLKKEGAPIILQGVTKNMDMKTTISPYGSPEFQLTECALTEIFHWLGLPTFGTAGCTDAKVADTQAAIESCFSCLGQALSGTNLVHDVGFLESGLTGSFDMLVMTNELLGMVKRFKQGIEVNEETMAVDLIDKVGIGGHFIQEKHTLDYFRSETWQPQLLDRSIIDDWEAEGSKDLAQRTKEYIGDILKQPREKKISDKQAGELSAIINSAKAD
jgi:trimethylamine--corrinoid protein Co-methyltransferase